MWRNLLTSFAIRLVNAALRVIRDYLKPRS